MHDLDRGRGRLTASGNSGYYSDPWVTEILLPYIPHLKDVLEPAAGRGGMVKVLRNAGINVVCGDIVPYKDEHVSILRRDFLRYRSDDFTKNIRTPTGGVVTAPPVHLIGHFIEKSLSLANPYGTVCMWLPSNTDMRPSFSKYFADSSELYMIIKPVCSVLLTKGQDKSWFLWRKGYWGPPLTVYSAVDVV